MEQFLIDVFLKILNMSLTASYVIAAVLLVRLLLKRAPKKYSYALWLAAAFRLVCPVSFESIFSIFSLKLFQLNVSGAYSLPASTIVHIPEDIGLMREPEISTGLASVNAVVNPMLPAPTTELTSANPLQIWIAIGMVLWCLGIAALLIFSFVNLIRLRLHLRGAIKLEDNVWQSEAVRSPFILGIARPKIYIPYGLRSDELGYVLRHEQSHIRRGDHIVKILAFAILCLHWFNPLVWLAYHLMGKDMELSCDERVLSGSPDISADYSTTLLSFAANRRFPAPTPLAFGETGVKTRIKNALRWHKPRVWVSITALVLCLAVVAACAANPKEESDLAVDEDPKVQLAGTYVPWDCIYMSPLSSDFILGGDSGFKFVFEDGAMTVIEQAVGKEMGSFTLGTSWQELPYTDDEWAAMQIQATGFYAPLSEQFVDISYCPLDDGKQFLMLADGQLWLVETYTEDGSELIWSIFSLVPEEDMGYAQSHYAIAVSSLFGIDINFDIENLDRVSILCETGTVAFQDEYGNLEIKDWRTDPDNTLWAGSSLVWSPINYEAGTSEPIFYPMAVIKFSAYTDIQGASGTIYIESKESDTSGVYVCTLRVVGTGLYIEQDLSGRISITHNGEGAFQLPDSVSEMDAGSPWNWTSTLSTDDIIPGIMYFGCNLYHEKILSSASLAESLVSALNAVAPDEIYPGRGSPSKAEITIYTEEGECVLSWGGGNSVEMRFEGVLAERYPYVGGVWEIHNQNLNSLFESLMVSDGKQPLYAWTSTVSGDDISSPTLSKEQTQELAMLLNAVEQEEVYLSSVTIPSQFTVNVYFGESCFIMRGDGEVVDVGIYGPAAEEYATDAGSWWIENDELSAFFRELMGLE